MHSSRRQAVAYSIFATYIRHTLTGFAQLGIVLVAARNLGAEQTGNLALLTLLPKVLATFLSLGTGSANVYYIASGRIEPEVAWAYSRNIVTVASLIGLSCGAAFIAFKPAFLFGEIEPLNLSISLASLPFILTVSAVASIFQAVQDFQRLNQIILVQPVLAFLGAGALWALDSINLNQLLAAITISHVASGCAALVTLRMRIQLLSQPNGVGSYAHQAIRYGAKVNISNIINFLNYRVDILLLNAIAGPSSTGLYAVAIRAAEQLWLISQAFATVVLPRFSESQQLSATRYNTVQKVVRIVFWITLIGALMVGICADKLITFLFGAGFLDASTTLRILLVGVVALSASQILFSDLASRGLVGINLVIAILILFVNVAGNLFLIPEFGTNGAAAATSGAFVVGLFMRLWRHSVLNRTIWWSPILPHCSELKAFKATWWGLGRSKIYSMITVFFLVSYLIFYG